MKRSSILVDCLASLIAGMLLGALVSALSEGVFITGWWKSALFSTLLILGTIRVARWMKADRSLAIMMAVAFLLRLGLGIFLYTGLPSLGYPDSPVQQAGYVFSDAAERDQAAFQIAVSGQPWLPQFSQHRASDQYGGLLAVSAAIYRVFSADAHRPLLIVLFSACAMAAGLALFHRSIARKWGGVVASIASWIFVLYPDGVLLGSSQMREPILISLTCLLYWFSLAWREKPLRTLIAMTLATLVLCLFSIPAAGAALAIVVGMIFVEWITLQNKPAVKWLGIAVFIVFLAGAVVAGWLWLKNALNYEYYLTTSASGVIQSLLETYSEKIRYPLITLYGLAQPVLPAALIDPSKPLWQGLAIFRALGWYFVLPFLVYGCFAVFKTNIENRSVLIFVSLALLAWILISSLRAGGDQWDNPRYRATFLPWIALLTGWVWQQLRSGKHPWFWRIVAVEGVFVLVFLIWYINRQHKVVPFGINIIVITALSAGILLGGFIWDKKTGRAGRSDPK